MLDNLALCQVVLACRHALSLVDMDCNCTRIGSEVHTCTALLPHAEKIRCINY